MSKFQPSNSEKNCMNTTPDSQFKPSLYCDPIGLNTVEKYISLVRIEYTKECHSNLRHGTEECHVALVDKLKLLDDKQSYMYWKRVKI